MKENFHIRVFRWFHHRTNQSVREIPLGMAETPDLWRAGAPSCGFCARFDGKYTLGVQKSDAAPGNRMRSGFAGLTGAFTMSA
jgi:hypothetical protein